MPLLDYQDYPVIAAKNGSMKRRWVIGVINYAYYLAKNGTKYSRSYGARLTIPFEALQYYLLVASNKAGS